MEQWLAPIAEAAWQEAERGVHGDYVSVEGLRRGVVRGVARTAAGAGARLSAADRRVARQSPVDPSVLEVPYWAGISRQLMARSGRLAAWARSSLVYRVEVLGDGPEPRWVLTAEPEGWAPLKPATDAQFPGPMNWRSREFREYIMNATVLTGLAVLGEESVFVTWGGLEVDGSAVAFRTVWGDLYTAGKVVDRVEVDGDVFAYSEASIFLRRRSTTEVGYELVELACRAGCCK